MLARRYPPDAIEGAREKDYGRIYEISIVENVMDFSTRAKLSTVVLVYG